MCCRVMVFDLCVYLSVTTLAATCLNMSKVERYTVSYRLLKICIVWTTFCSGDMALLACDDWQFGSFSTKNTLMVLDTIIQMA